MFSAAAQVSFADSPNQLPWPQAQAIVQSIKPPTFPNQNFPITKFGAIANSNIDCTSAIASAITSCSNDGGGHVIIPSGKFLTGAIKLSSNVDLHLEAGAILQFSPNPAEYPPEPTRYQGIDLINYSPAVYANSAANIAITGQGTLEGTLTAKWNKGGSGYSALEKMERDGVPISRRVFATPARGMRTVFIEPYNCTNVLIQGVTIRDANFWQIHPLLCTNVIVDGVTTYTTSATGNTDGCDPESCKNVLIENCDLGAGDDCIAIKAGRNPDTQRVHRPCENLVIMHDRFHGPWGMITLGSEITDGVRNVYAYDLSTTSGPARGGGTGDSVRLLLYMKSNKLRGGYATNVHIAKVRGKFSGGIINATLVYEGVKTGPTPPVFDDITVSDVQAQSPDFLDVSGLSDDPIGGITLSNCQITGVKKKNLVRDVKNLIFQNVTVNGVAVK